MPAKPTPQVISPPHVGLGGFGVQCVYGADPNGRLSQRSLRAKYWRKRGRPEEGTFMTTFPIDEKTLAQFNRRFWRKYLWLLLFLAISYAIFVFLDPYRRAATLQSKVIVVVISCLLFGLILLVGMARATAGYRKFRLVLSAEGIEHWRGDDVVRVPYQDIQRIEIIMQPSGEPANIMVYHSGQRFLNLFGFQDMEIIANALEQALAGKAAIQRKPDKLDLKTLLIRWILVAVVVFGMVMACEALAARF
jgi:hypothetical protein